jgi:hypothetical protein
MLSILILCSSLATTQDAPRAPDDRADAPRATSTPAEAEALAKYNAQMAKPPENAADHWKMALWCEQNGLQPEAYFHYGRVIELDPKRDAAWQKLGFKKVAGRWITAEQIASEALQKLADKEWSARLKKWHKEIHGGKKQAETRDAMEKVTDPAAVPSIYREFCGGSGADQEIALQMLGQIDGPIASKVIVVMAIYGKTPSARRFAIELLRGRPTGEYLELLVSLMKDTLKYEVRPVGGPGSPGILFVEGERFNVQRFYAPPPAPSMNPRPGDAIGYDANGFPVISRTTSHTTATGPKVGVPGSKSLVTERDLVTTTTETFSFGEAMAEAQRSAMTAQAQLQADVARIDSINESIRRFNELVMTAAQAATGKNPGRTAKEWRDMLAQGKDGRYARRSRPVVKPTIDEMVPLAYVPDLSAAITFQRQTQFVTQTIVDT